MTTPNIHHLPRLGLSNAMRIFGLTARALRFYEEKGLIEAHRDRLNCRYYDATARNRLEWIARLRREGLTLARFPVLSHAPMLAIHGVSRFRKA